MKRFCAVLTVFILLLSPVMAFAVETQESNPELLTRKQRIVRSIEKYGEKVGAKYNFGMPNLIMGWTNIFTEPIDRRETSGAKWKRPFALVGNTVIGVGLALVDTVGGAANVLTSPVTTIIPLPRGGVDAARLSTGKQSS